MLTSWSLANSSCSNVLHPLWPLVLGGWHTVIQRVAVIQPRSNDGTSDALCNITRQRAPDRSCRKNWRWKLQALTVAITWVSNVIDESRVTSRKERKVCEVCDRQTDGQMTHFRWWMYPTICVIWSFWCWFDPNRSIFDEDVREKRLLLLPFRSPFHLKYASIVTCANGHIKFEVSTAFWFRVNRRRTDGQTDGRGATLYAASRKGRIICRLQTDFGSSDLWSNS